MKLYYWKVGGKSNFDYGDIIMYKTWQGALDGNGSSNENSSGKRIKSFSEIKKGGYYWPEDANKKEKQTLHEINIKL